MNNTDNPGQRGAHHAGISHETSNRPAPDVTISHHGSVALFHPQTELARDWMHEHCPARPDHAYFGDALVVEPRYVEDLLAHAMEDGLNNLQGQEVA